MAEEKSKSTISDQVAHTALKLIEVVVAAGVLYVIGLGLLDKIGSIV